MEFRKNAHSVKHAIAFPFIYLMIVPLVILDLFFTIYHIICFPLFGIPLVKRSDYIKIDRHKLSYLKFDEKIYCAYCGYGNGLLYYCWVIAGKTEKYWCGIKHNRDDGFVESPHHKDFLEYGNEKEFTNFVDNIEKKQ